MKDSKRKFAVMTAIGTVVLALILTQALFAADRLMQPAPDGSGATPDTRTPEEMLRDYMEGHYVSPDVADLSESSKGVDKAQAKAGSTLEYTVTVRNTGDEFTPASITDTLPAELTFVPGSLAVVGGGTANEDSGVITWEGAVNDNSDITITFEAVIDGEVAVDTEISNSVEISGGGQMLTRTAVTTIVEQNIPDRTSSYLPIARKSLNVPTLSVSRPNSQNQWTASWSSSPSATGYEIQESRNPSFDSSTIHSVTGTSQAFQHAPSVNNIYYYRVRSVDANSNQKSAWSSSIEVVAGFRDGFTVDNAGDWSRRRLTHIDNINDWYEIEPDKDKHWYIVQVADKWDWTITSPLARAPQVPYAIEYRSQIVSPGNLVSYGIVFGGDLAAATCPNPNPPTTVEGWYEHKQCFNHFYATNTIYFGDTKLLFERVDRLVWCPSDPGCKGGGSPMKRGADTKLVERVPMSDHKEMNTWRVEVREDSIQVFVNDKFVMRYDANDDPEALRWIHEPYFGLFGTTNEYEPSTGRHDYYSVMPLDS